MRQRTRVCICCVVGLSWVPVLASHADSALSTLPTDKELLGGLLEKPWLSVPDTSRQYFPIFVGATPVQLVNGQKPDSVLRLPAQLRKLADKQADLIRQTLGSRRVELLIWPTQDWNGQPNWVYARYRTSPKEPWRFLVDGENWLPFWNQEVGTKPLLPTRYVPSQPDDASTLFDDFLQSSDLYFQPQFGNCVYVDRSTSQVVLKWPHPDSQSRHEATLRTPGRYLAYCMNQPARHGSEPLAMVLAVENGKLDWPAIDWQNPPVSPGKIDEPLRIASYPVDFEAQFRKDLRIFSGVDPVVLPKSGVSRRFVKKGSFQPDHDLEHMVDYLEQRYARLGIQTERQRFLFRNIAQSNLIAKLPGIPRADGKPLPKVILADHIDSAVEEDTFEKTGQRVTTPGADDNVTATAVLLRAAVALRTLPRNADVWLVHLTGEEFPSDDLGAWRFAEKLLADRVEVRALLISDFIGWHPAGDRSFQINATSHPLSAQHAALALDASAKLAPSLRSHYVPRHTVRSAVYQTDVQVFEFLGFPGLLFNEHIDYRRADQQSPHNHQSSDTVENLDIPFAAEIAKVMIETVARLANLPAP
ncbi:MAG TPA: M28 family peptidase [Pseudomonadota bacterium]|nr:M28 family peptidase [Pseudomonadota bacterium]